jgi:membrane-bound ClpP family serine protease
MRIKFRLTQLAGILLPLFAFTSGATADRFVLRDGSAIDGDFTAEDQTTITVEQSGPFAGVTLSRKLNKSQVQTWYRSAREGPAYVVIPMFGVIGEDVTAASVRAGLSEARALKPRYVVLAIDSPGGSIREMFDILDALWERNDSFEIVAYVKDAYSAAAVIAMSCERVYMKPSGAIGAAVPFKITENGPADVEAKFRSVIEAGMRAANAHGGHADLLMRGMSDMNFELYLTEKNGEPELTTSGPGRLLKSKGQILTLTAAESAACGLSRVAGEMSEVGQQLAGGPWHVASGRPWRAVISWFASSKRVAGVEEH